MNARSFLTKCVANEDIPVLARDIGVRTDQIYAWLKGTNKIYPKIARRLGRYFQVGPENFLEAWYETTGTSFGEELKRRRLRMGLSLSDLAPRLGYCEKTICNWENGYRIKKEKQDEIRMLFESVESHLPKNF